MYIYIHIHTWVSVYLQSIYLYLSVYLQSIYLYLSVYPSVFNELCIHIERARRGVSDVEKANGDGVVTR
ncbi:hypothetical protein CSUI_003385 [Cystoisospora suis]|uniref:Transmembrane protein n=1 Tax=Cystoisospora suis TaxID=483139 RepID=A0A2C6L530_9APIC|nr:hypothetical protein CSUI_003385 [Cystoisospora suis]